MAANVVFVFGMFSADHDYDTPFRLVKLPINWFSVHKCIKVGMRSVIIIIVLECMHVLVPRCVSYTIGCCTNGVMSDH